MFHNTYYFYNFSLKLVKYYGMICIAYFYSSKQTSQEYLIEAAYAENIKQIIICFIINMYYIKNIVFLRFYIRLICLKPDITFFTNFVNFQM